MSDVPARPRHAKRARRGADPSAESTAIERVPFHGEELEAVREGERVLIPIRRVCEVLGLATQRQLVKLHSKPWAVVTMKVMTAPDGKSYETACIDLDSLPMWLATLEASRVKPELREKLTTYQREASRVLREHFFGERKPLELPAAPEPRKLPASRNAALRRIEDAGHVLDYVEQDLAMLVRLPKGGAHGQLYYALHCGIAWAMYTISGADYALDEPGVRKASEAARERWKRVEREYGRM